MARIVVCEFMDERAVAQMAARHDVLYDPALVDDEVWRFSQPWPKK